MKVFVQPQGLHSLAMKRVAIALQTYAPPDMEFVSHSSEADLVVLHVIGYPETEEAVNTLIKRGKKYVIMQYCVRTTQKPDTKDWLLLWQMAEAVWSYYDLEAMLNVDFGVDLRDWKFPFYHAPLGVDAAFRKVSHYNRTIGAMTSGYVCGSKGEAIEEVGKAAIHNGLPVVHLGPSSIVSSEGGHIAPLGHRWSSVTGIDDTALAQLYSRSRWVSGLRHGEGFELPAAEGLCCGARPILFDRPEMRRWYDGHAVFVPESSGDRLTEELTKLMA